MKILHVDETFHPAFGYQANPLAKYQHIKGYEVTILSVKPKYMRTFFRNFGDDGSKMLEQDKEYTKKTGVNVVRINAWGLISNRVVFNFFEMFKTIKEINPDIIMAHQIEALASIQILFKLHKKYPIVFDSHMLPMATQNKFVRIYEKFFRRFISSLINKKRLFVIRTQDDLYVNNHLNIDERLTPFISFGTDTDLFHPDLEIKKSFKKEYNIPDDAFIITYTGKLTVEKGGKLLAEALKKKFSTERETVAVIVGSSVGDYGREVEEIFELSENRIIRFPTQLYDDLPKFYQIADVVVFAKQCSMSFYDAEACGVPVISEDNNINVERCSHGNGANFKAGDAKDFHRVIKRYVEMDKSEYDKESFNSYNYIVTNFDYGMIEKQYTDILVSEHRRFHDKNKKG